MYCDNQIFIPKDILMETFSYLKRLWYSLIPAEECKNVRIEDRCDCGGHQVGPKACEEKKCCYDYNARYWDVACYYPIGKILIIIIILIIITIIIIIIIIIIPIAIAIAITITIHDETQVGLDWKYPISELIKLRLTTWLKFCQQREDTGIK